MVLTQHTMKNGTLFVIKRFHTTMVLTQLWQQARRFAILSCFHTTMVLTQLNPPSRELPLSGFPYHYGSHATPALNLNPPSRECFHTTMVLTQHTIWKWGLWVFFVSIPLWFSRNPRSFPMLLRLSTCFHTTMVLTQPQKPKVKRRDNKVSIPLWFSRNSKSVNFGDQEFTSFPYHYGSHATWNMRRTTLRCLSSFHTTMVLTQQKGRRRESSKITCFHTTMVLTQLNAGWIRYCNSKWVSIPLWFSRNRVRVVRKLSTFFSFHTTMVLTQRALSLWNVGGRNQFPYHYGSHATMNRNRFIEAIDKRFHTTMVLTQRMLQVYQLSGG